MKLAWLREDLASTRRAALVLVALLVVSLLANVILALVTARLSGRERVVVVPPTVHKTFWVEAYPKLKQQLQRQYPKHEWR